MTKEEHALMIALLATQLEMCNAIQKLLESCGIIVDDDVQAFLAIRTPSERGAMNEKARLIYASLARAAGIDIREAGILP